MLELECVCGHVADEHEVGGRECTVETEYDGTVEKCGCLMFESSEEFE